MVRSLAHHDMHNVLSYSVLDSTVIVIGETAISESVPLNIDLPCVLHATDLPEGGKIY